MTAETVPERDLDRRFLMRGGAVLAGAAGLAAVGAAMAPTAQAATGQFMVVGQPNSADLSTTITTTNNATTPTLSLVSTTGPSLKLHPLSTEFDNALAVGEIANTREGPLMGVDYGDGFETTYLVTGIDLDARPFPYPVGPVRLMDTRDALARSTIIGSSPAPFDSKGQLKTGAYIDISIAPMTVGPLSAAFLNLTAVKPATGGFLVAYPSGIDGTPGTSTLNYIANATISNSAFVALGVLNGMYAIRVYAAKASHVIVDLSGVVLGGEPTTSTPPPPPPVGARQMQQARRITKMRSAMSKTARR